MGKQSIISAFKNAFAGIWYCIVYERNMKIHLIVAFLVGGLAWRMELNRYEMLILLLTVASVLITEMFNTVVETLVDLVSPQIHPLAKVAKDVAAGMVLVVAIASVLVGYVLFFSRIWH
jgi:diacylglycerol kinase